MFFLGWRKIHRGRRRSSTGQYELRAEVYHLITPGTVFMLRKAMREA